MKGSVVFGGNEKSVPREIIRPTDRLAIDPSLLRGEQNNMWACAYISLNTMLLVQDGAYHEASQNHALLQAQDAAALGISFAGDRRDWLSKEEFKRVLKDLAEPEAAAFDNLDLAFNDYPLQHIITDGFVATIHMVNEAHAITIIGISDSGLEYICWDPFTGHADTKYENTRLRRIKVVDVDSSFNITVWGGLMPHKLFKPRETPEVKYEPPLKIELPPEQRTERNRDTGKGFLRRLGLKRI